MPRSAGSLFVSPRSTRSAVFSPYMLVAGLVLLASCLASPLAYTQDWTNTGQGDWFDSTNWSTVAVPTATDDATINNGGTAEADSGTAPGAMEALNLFIGVDGGSSGSLTSNGVDLEAQFPLQIGVISPGHIGGGTATGTARFSGADILPFPQASFASPLTDRINVGSAYTTGQAVGRLELTNGELPIELFGLAAGRVEFDAADTDASAVADGTLILRSVTANGGAAWDVSSVFTEADGSSGLSTAFLQAESLTNSVPLSVADVRSNGSNSSATASATIVLTDFITNSRIEFIEAIASGDNASAEANLNASLTRAALNGARLDAALCRADEPNAVVLPTRADITVADSALNLTILDLTQVDTRDTGVAECTSVMTVTDSTLDFSSDGITIAEVDANDDSQGTASGELTLNASSVVTNRLDIGEGSSDGTSVAVMEASLTANDSTMTANSVRVGFWRSGNSTGTGNSITSRLALNGSDLDTPLLLIGSDNPTAFLIDAELSLNPSYARTDDLQLGPDSRILLSVEGPARATATNLDQSGLYAAIDADAATLEGEVIVSIDYPAQAGATFDVITAAAGALSGSTATFSVVSALPGAAQIGVVTEGGRDVLRVSISSAFAPPAAPADSPVAVPVNPPLALAILAVLLALLAAASIGRRRDAP